jgi:hypothetical protein
VRDSVRPRFSRIVAAAVAAALHGTIIYYLLTPRTERAHTYLPTQPPLEVTFFSLARKAHAKPSPKRGLRSGMRPTDGLRKNRPLPSRMIVEGTTLPEARKNVPHVQIDWAREADREVQVMASRLEKKSRRGPFGPRRPAEPVPSVPRHEWDGWDYAATHRIVRLPQGGTVINLNDRCAIVIIVIPMIGCQLGRIDANNSDMFKDLRTYRDDEPNALP